MKKMLLVEDDYLSQELMKRIFKNEYELDICESTEEYYSKYSKIGYSVIIMDNSLKGEKPGIDLIKEIRDFSFHKDVPIICLTAHALALTREKAITAGTDLFLTKPISNAKLAEAVDLLIKQKESTHSDS